MEWHEWRISGLFLVMQWTSLTSSVEEKSLKGGEVSGEWSQVPQIEVSTLPRWGDGSNQCQDGGSFQEEA